MIILRTNIYLGVSEEVFLIEYLLSSLIADAITYEQHFNEVPDFNVTFTQQYIKISTFEEMLISTNAFMHLITCMLTACL